MRARRVGDPLTIVLVERTAASKSATSIARLRSTGSPKRRMGRIGTSTILVAGGVAIASDNPDYPARIEPVGAVTLVGRARMLVRTL